MVDRLPLGQPGEAHTFNDALPLGEEGWIAAGSAGAEPAKCEVRIKRKSCLRSGPRLVQRTKQRQASCKKKLRYRKIAIGLDAAAQACDAFRVGTKRQLCHADKRHPPKSEDISRRQTKGFLNMEGETELWIDAATGMPIREAGQFVKTPSLFLKKIAFVRDYEIRDGVAYPLHIQSTVDTRIVGRAELEIRFSNFSRDNAEDEASVGADAETVPGTHTSDVSAAPETINTPPEPGGPQL